MKLLVSVRSVAEAALLAQTALEPGGGADFIDLKEPRDGALGGLPVATVRDIVSALHAAGCTLPTSATIGDLPMRSAADVAAIVRQAQAVGECGVTYVKVGIEPQPQATAVLDALAALPFAVVPVFIADKGVDFTLADHALQHHARRAAAFPAVMLDTADKLSGSLFDVAAKADLQSFVARARSAGVLAGLAGALRLQHLPALAELAPDFAGFRSAVCAGSRGSALSVDLLRALAAQLKTAAGGLQ